MYKHNVMVEVQYPVKNASNFRFHLRVIGLSRHLNFATIDVSLYKKLFPGLSLPADC